MNPRSHRLLPLTGAAGALLLAAAVLTGCGHGGPAAGSSRAVGSSAGTRPIAVRSSPAASASPKPLPRPAFIWPELGPVEPYRHATQVKHLFIALATNYCGPAAFPDAQATVPDPKRAKIRRGPTKTEWRVTDADGNTFLINVASARVYALDGPGGTLPGPYTFGCDPYIFPGTWD